MSVKGGAVQTQSVLSKSEVLRRLDLECPTLKQRITLDFSDPATCELLETIRDLMLQGQSGKPVE